MKRIIETLRTTKGYLVNPPCEADRKFRNISLAAAVWKGVGMTTFLVLDNHIGLPAENSQTYTQMVALKLAVRCALFASDIGPWVVLFSSFYLYNRGFLGSFDKKS